MKLPLTLYSLLLLATLMAFFLVERADDARGSARKPLRLHVRRALRDLSHVYLPFAAVAVLMIALGKPERLPQYIGWAVLGVQAVYLLTVPWHTPPRRTVLGLLGAAGVAWLWVLQLPYFDLLPL